MSLVSEIRKTAVGKAAIAETLAIAGTLGTLQGNIGKNTSTEGLTAAQEKIGKAGDANNTRDARIGVNTSKKRDIMN
jgi:hypothetical protein